MIALRRPVRPQFSQFDQKKGQMNTLPLEEIFWSLEASELLRRGSWRRKSAMMQLAEEPRIFCDRGTSPLFWSSTPISPNEPNTHDCYLGNDDLVLCRGTALCNLQRNLVGRDQLFRD